jgi:hypothetical protein
MKSVEPEGRFMVAVATAEVPEEHRKARTSFVGKSGLEMKESPGEASKPITPA